MVYWRKRRPVWLEFLGLKDKQEELIRWRSWGLSALALLVLALVVTTQEQRLGAEDGFNSYSRSSGRRLLEANETDHHECRFEFNNYKGAWIFCYCIIIIIVFIAIAIICDDFFVPSLEIISEKLNLSEDVAGATFMAAGSSAPELFTSVAGVAQETDVGVGTIVGSAVFNLLMIIAMTAALAGQVLHLDWRPLLRDSFFYAMSIGCFIGFAWDGYFQHYEAAFLLSLYILYIVLMVFNPKIMDWMATFTTCRSGSEDCKTEISPSSDDAERASDAQTQLNHNSSSKGDLSKANGERKMSLTGGHARRISIIHRERSHSEERIFHHKRGSVAGVLICPPPKHLTHSYLNRKDSGFQSHENSSYNASCDTSHTDMQRATPDGQRGSRPPLVRNGYLATKPGSPTDDIEMTTVENPSNNGSLAQEEQELGVLKPLDRRFRNRRTYSEDTPSPRDEHFDDHHKKLQRSHSSEHGRMDLYYGPPAAPKLPPIAPHSNNDSESSLTNIPNPDSSSSPREHPETPSGSTHTCNSAQALVSDDLEQTTNDHARDDLCSSDPTLQTPTAHHHIKKPDDDPISEDDKNRKEEPEEEEEEEEDETMNICPCCPCCPVVRTHPPSSETAREEGGCWNWCKLFIRWIIFIPAFPFVCLFSWTIPDCSKDHLKKYYIFSFIMSVAWIAGLSFVLVTVVERGGCLLNIDTYIMGLVIVAIGTSIPDALSSVLVARDGYGDMAVSNAIGSNVFDINLGLGLPFIIRICIDKGAPIILLDTNEWVDFYNGEMSILPHAKFGFILLLILFIALIVFGIARFKLNKWIGICFVIMYLMFLAYAFTQELYCIRQLGIYC